MTSQIISNVPYIYQGVTPSCHETTLRMLLKFYGFQFTSSYILNLSGLNYGFKYFQENHFAIACSESPMGPWPLMAYAAEKIGCKINFIKGKPWNETWNLIKEFIDKGIPIYMPLLNMQSLWKTSFPIPHVVLLCGYDEEKGVVMIHDPALGEKGEGIHYLPIPFPPREGDMFEGKSGAYAEFNIEDFKKACDLSKTSWEKFGKNGLAIISAPNFNPACISWGEILERNGKLTLGLIDEVIGPEINNDKTNGPYGLEKLSNDFEDGFGIKDNLPRLIMILQLLKSTVFQIGGAYKKSGYAFLSGLAAGTHNKDIEKASLQLSITANLYDQGFSEMELLINRRDFRTDKFAIIAKLLRQIARNEKEVGELLLEASKRL